MKKQENFERQEDFFDGLSDGGKLILFGLPIMIIIFIMAIIFSPNQNPPLQINQTVDNCSIVNYTIKKCDCEHLNVSTYDIPEALPNMSALAPDYACNDFCYVEACRYGCEQWSNLGLLNGRCQCNLQQCIISENMRGIDESG